MARSTTAIIALAAALGAAACEPTYTNHGFAPQVAQLDQIAAGTDTRGSVLRKLGRPSVQGAFDEESWFYETSRVEHFAFYEPKVIDRQVVAIRFDERGLVSNVARYGVEDGKVIDLITRTTPTYGREVTVLQQLFGNLGRVNAEQLQSGGPLPGS